MFMAFAEPQMTMSARHPGPNTLPNKNTRKRGKVKPRKKTKRPARRRKTAPKRTSKANSSTGFKTSGGGGSQSIGARIGATLGNFAQKALMSLIGQGDYTVQANSVIQPSHADKVPLMNGDNGVIRVRHREYLKDVFSSNAFTNTVIVIQPRNYACFPWLSTYAQSFEQYRLLGCVFEYKSLSGAISSSQALGSVTMATQYNVANKSFGSKSQALNHYFGCSTVPSDDLMHAIECKDMYDPYKLYWIRPENPAANFTDQRLEDYGNFNLIVSGCPTDNQVIGELWVTYDMLLLKPRLRTSSQTVLILDAPEPQEDPFIYAEHKSEWHPECCAFEDLVGPRDLELLPRQELPPRSQTPRVLIATPEPPAPVAPPQPAQLAAQAQPDLELRAPSLQPARTDRSPRSAPLQ